MVYNKNLRIIFSFLLSYSQHLIDQQACRSNLFKKWEKKSLFFRFYCYILDPSYHSLLLPCMTTIDTSFFWPLVLLPSIRSSALLPKVILSLQPSHFIDIAWNWHLIFKSKVQNPLPIIQRPSYFTQYLIEMCYFLPGSRVQSGL